MSLYVFTDLPDMDDKDVYLITSYRIIYKILVKYREYISYISVYGTHVTQYRRGYSETHNEAIIIIYIMIITMNTAKGGSCHYLLMIFKSWIHKQVTEIEVENVVRNLALLAFILDYFSTL